jgi:hypothetical protein
MSAVSCMGGWCAKRGSCALHLVPKRIIVERLCEPGESDSFERVIVRRPAGTWEQPQFQPAALEALH